MTETRAEKAQRLVDEGRVEITRRSIYATTAVVKGANAAYVTDIYPTGTFWCTCDWGMFHNYTPDLCAHALALRLVTEKEVGADHRVCRYCGRDDSKDKEAWTCKTICPYCVSDLRAWI